MCNFVSGYATKLGGVLLGGCWIFDGKKATAKQILQGRIVAIINGAYMVGAYMVGARISEGMALPKGWKRTIDGIVVEDAS
jgi:hypothetical protein